ncbi:hypothetical protein D3C72_1932090 [compost metagenome]
MPRRLRKPVSGSVMLARFSLPIFSCRLVKLRITARFRRSASKYQAFTDCTRCMATATSWCSTLVASCDKGREIMRAHHQMASRNARASGAA